jgi:hypothetical protein
LRTGERGHGGRGGGNASNQDNPVNRIADLNPNDIERIRSPQRRLRRRDLWRPGDQWRGDHYHQAGAYRRSPVQISQRFGISGISHKLGFHNFRDSAEVAGVFVRPWPRSISSPASP